MFSVHVHAHAHAQSQTPLSSARFLRSVFHVVLSELFVGNDDNTDPHQRVSDSAVSPWSVGERESHR